MKKIYRKVKNNNISIQHACEVGVYLPETSNIIDFIKDRKKITLVEADPVTAEKIRSYFKDYTITLFNVAVWDHNGKIRLSKANASTFVTSLEKSPALVNDKYTIEESNTFEIDCMVFTDIDDGTIDLLSVDIEGSEWYVIKNLVSRPRVISVETHGKYYTNPFFTEISNWMQQHNYITWYKDLSDTVYVQSNLLTPGLGDKITTRFVEWKISWKKFKRIFKRKK